MEYGASSADSLHVVFKRRAIKDEFQSQEQGRPIYKEVDWVEVTWDCGKSKLSTPAKVTNDYPDNERHDLRWPEHWKRYCENNKTEGIVGTPIEELPSLGLAKAATYKALSIHTVEQLAALTDSELSQIGMGGRTDQAKAKAYLAVAEESAEAGRFATENERLKDDVKNLQEQLAAFQAQMLGSTTVPVEPIETKSEVEEIFGDVSND